MNSKDNQPGLSTPDPHKESVRIFVVGYPKSGNTWLTRLVARTLKGHVERYTVDQINPELAADLNNEMAGDKGIRVFKLHLSPENLIGQFQVKDSDRFLYIHRNPLDVLVSSFFYFEKFPETYLRIGSQPKGLKHYLIRMKHRHHFGRFLRKFCSKGIPNMGTWESFHAKWCTVREEEGLQHLQFISYEQLRQSTASELTRVLTNLNIAYESERLPQVIEAEGFENRKEAINESDESLTFGKNFNLRFLRKGEVADYKNFMSAKQIAYLNSHIKTPQ